MNDYANRKLIEYLPDVLKEVREYQALTHGEQPEIHMLLDGIQNVLDSEFVLSSGEYGVRRRERILGIIPKASYTLDERKFAILARLGEQMPYTYRTLELILNELCGVDGYKMTLLNKEYILEVWVQLVAKHKVDEVDAMLKRIVPANLVIKLALEFNQHITLKPFTHEFLGGLTHRQLRDQLFDEVQ
jgi:hypothetical protein